MASSRRSLAWLAVAVGAALCLHARRAAADEKTWCVGGFNGAPQSLSTTSQACESEQRNRALPSWHWHNSMFVTKDHHSCKTCWDQGDMTCETDGVAHYGWIVISAAECANIGPAPITDKAFFDPEHKWNPKGDPIHVVPLDDEDLRPGPAPTPTPRPRPVAPPPDNAVTQAPVTPPPDNAVTQAPVTPPPDNTVTQPVTPPTPGKPTPTAPPRPSATPITIQVGVRVSPGPYAISDPVTMTGFATSSGTARAVTGGYFQWIDPTGKPVAGPDGKPIKIPAKAGPGGTAVATAPAPIAGSLTVQYQPGGLEVHGSETLATKPPPGQVGVTVAQCRLRGVVTAPVQGELIATTAPMKLVLKGRFETAGNVASTQLGGATPSFSVDLDGKEQKLPAKDAGGELTAEYDLTPPEAESAELTIRLFGEGGANDVCPGVTTIARVTKLGIALAVQPTHSCYVGKPCPLEAKFLLPRDPAPRAIAEKFAGAPDLELVVHQNGADAGALAAAAPGNPESTFAGTFVPLSPGAIEVEVVARSKAQNRDIKETVHVTVREPIELHLPAELDMGTVSAGTGWPAGCAILDFSKSRGVIEQIFALKSTMPHGCNSRPAVLANGLGAPLPDGLDLEMQYDTRQVKICLADVPRCSDESPEPVVLTILPKNPDFADQKAELKLRWKVAGRSFLACHWWWLATGLGGILLLLIGYGFVKPYNFAAHDALKMAADRGKLTRAVGRRLRELPGGRAGWYRDAATGLREDGSNTAKLGQAAVVLQARKGDVLLKSRGGLSRVHPQSKKVEPLDTGKDGVLASKGIIYVVGNLHFTID